MYSERPQGRALTVREACGSRRVDAEASAAASVAGRRSWSADGGGSAAPEAQDPHAGGDPGSGGQLPSAGISSWCALMLLLQIQADEGCTTAVTLECLTCLYLQKQLSWVANALQTTRNTCLPVPCEFSCNH